jgi:hypothetical protein
MRRKKKQAKLEKYFPKIVDGDTSGNNTDLNVDGWKSDQNSLNGLNVDGETGDLTVDGGKGRMVADVTANVDGRKCDPNSVDVMNDDGETCGLTADGGRVDW